MNEKWWVYNAGVLVKTHEGQIGLHDNGALILLEGRETVALIAAGAWTSTSCREA